MGEVKPHTQEGGMGVKPPQLRINAGGYQSGAGGAGRTSIDLRRK